MYKRQVLERLELRLLLEFPLVYKKLAVINRISDKAVTMATRDQYESLICISCMPFLYYISYIITYLIYSLSDSNDSRKGLATRHSNFC